MNTKIFSLISQQLQKSFSLPRYKKFNYLFDQDIKVNELHWTPARFKKFQSSVESELQLSSNFVGTLKEIVNDFDCRYSSRFFGEIWKPRTDEYTYTGWQLIHEINESNPQRVLDVGCGYHPFKNRIKNIIGIDPYNNCADYMIDILDYRVEPGSHDVIIALGSINFNSFEDIDLRFGHCVNLLSPGGRFYLRCNPGITWPQGPYVDIFPWTFEIAHTLAKKYNLDLTTVKRDHDRLAIFFTKPAT